MPFSDGPRMKDPRGTAEQFFRKTGNDAPETFQTFQPRHRFDVVNSGTSHLMLVITPAQEFAMSPRIVRLAPGERKTVAMAVRKGATSFPLSYAVSRSMTPFLTHTNRYRAYSDGETVLCVPVSAPLFESMRSRAKGIIEESRALVTDKAMHPDTFIYTPGPFYRSSGLFARDVLYQLEGAGRDTVTAEEVKRAVDFMALNSPLIVSGRLPAPRLQPRQCGRRQRFVTFPTDC